jgi:hypothetical protein
MGVAPALQCPWHAVDQRPFDIENDNLAIHWFLQPVGTHWGHESSYGMKETLDSRLKTALDESRLLILGAQVLFGFQFQAVFQDRFNEISSDSKLIHGVGLLLLLVTVGALIAPSMQHQITYRGESRRGALKAATALAGASLLPLSLGLGVAAFVIFDHLLGRTSGLALGCGFAGVALALLYGLGFALKRSGETGMEAEERITPLKTKIEQLLTEARVMIPGGQALLGFQFVATLSKSFSDFPPSVQYVHAAGLCAVALSVLFLMTPAALHRIAYQGGESAEFFKIASKIVIAAALPLAAGISADVFVVFYKITESPVVASTVGVIAFGLLVGFWYAYPLWRAAERRGRYGIDHGNVRQPAAKG